MSKHNLQLHDSIRTMAQAFPIVASIHKAEDGGYWVESPQLAGCFAAGDTVGETLHNFKFAIFEYFDVPKKHQNPEGFKMEAIDFPEPRTSRKPAPVTFVPTPALALC